MNILFVCPVFPPEIVPSAVMLGQLTRHLSLTGHKVTMITCFPSLPGGRIFKGYKRRFWKITETGTLRLIRCFSFTIGSKRKRLWRALSHLSFGLIAALRLLFEKKPDVIVTDMVPVISSPFIVFLAKFLRIPVVNYIQDLFPEAVESAGMIPHQGVAARIALALDALTCKAADANIVISESFRKALLSSRGVPDNKIFTLHNWIDGSEIRPTNRLNQWRAQAGIPHDRFIAMFAGTLGIVSGAEVLVDVALELNASKVHDVLIICIGEGVLKETMIRRSESLGLDNIWFLPFQPGAALSEVQSTADVFLLTMDKSQANSSVPSKLVTYLAIGRPVVCATDKDSAVAETVARANCGHVVPPGDAKAIAAKIVYLKKNNRERSYLGTCGRSFFEEYYDMPAAMKKFDVLLSRLSRIPENVDSTVESQAGSRKKDRKSSAAIES
jgi:colanic acid biosynthesis glycosyl transferase WcaI